jgi:hypothetical protein
MQSRLLSLRSSKFTLRSSSFTLRSLKFTLRSSKLTLRSSKLTLRSSKLTLRSSTLTLRSSTLTLRSSTLTLRSSTLTLRSSFPDSGWECSKEALPHAKAWRQSLPTSFTKQSIVTREVYSHSLPNARCPIPKTMITSKTYKNESAPTEI